MAEKRYFIEDSIVWEIPAETEKEAREYYEKYLEGEDDYPFKIGLKLEFNETKIVDDDGEELSLDE